MIESFSEGNTLIIKLCPIWSTKDDSIIVYSLRLSHKAKNENHPTAIYSPSLGYLSKITTVLKEEQGQGVNVKHPSCSSKNTREI